MTPPPLNVIAVAAAVILLLFLLARWFSRHLTRSDVEFREQNLLRPHEIRETALLEFPRLNQEFYDNAKAELEEQGFRYVADIEDMTLAASNSNPRSAMRIMVSPDGVMAAVLQIDFKFAKRLIARHLGGMRSPYFVEFVCEAIDGRFFSGVVAPPHMQPHEPPEVTVVALPTHLSPGEAYRQYLDSLTAFLRKNPDFELLRPKSLKEILASNHRQELQRVRYRSRVGALTREELLEKGWEAKIADDYLKSYNKERDKLEKRTARADDARQNGDG